MRVLLALAWLALFGVICPSPVQAEDDDSNPSATVLWAECSGDDSPSDMADILGIDKGNRAGWLAVIKKFLVDYRNKKEAISGRVVQNAMIIFTSVDNKGGMIPVLKPYLDYPDEVARETAADGIANSHEDGALKALEDREQQLEAGLPSTITEDNRKQGVVDDLSLITEILLDMARMKTAEGDTYREEAIKRLQTKYQGTETGRDEFGHLEELTKP